MLKISLSSIMVDDQDKALKFYTEILGFEKKTDITMGDFRWLTVADGIHNIELALVPSSFSPSQTYQKALFEADMPITAFTTEDIQADYQRLKALGVNFRGGPKSMGLIMAVLFEDTCGNLISLVEPL